MRWLSATTLAFLLVCASGTTATAQFSLAADPPAGDREREELYRLVKRFEFDERKLGNFEDVPMHWRRLTGPGLPAYSRGNFDESVGHNAPPSFQLVLETGNVAYEYDHLDLTVVPESDYLIAAQIRPHRLGQAAAFVAAYLVDRYGDRVAESERVSRLVRSAAAGDDDWQVVELLMPGSFPHAYALRLQLWILQDSVWRSNEADAVDPIVRNDIRCAAWFDEVAVYRLPRARLSFTHPAGLVLPGKQESLLLDVHNATAQTLEAQVRITNEAGQSVHESALDIPSTDRAPARVLGRASEKRGGEPSGILRPSDSASGPNLRAPLPELPPGMYTAILRVLSGGESLLERRLRFAVVPPLPAPTNRRSDVGLDLGLWRGGDINGIVQAAGELAASAVRVGVPLTGATSTAGAIERLNDVGSLVRELTKRRVDALGVLMLDDSLVACNGPTTIRELFLQSDATDLISPTFAFFGGLIRTWQVDDDALEPTVLSDWSQPMLLAVRDQLRRFITAPDLIVPVSALSDPLPCDFTRSIWIPTAVALRDLPRQLEPFVSDDARTMLRLQSPKTARTVDRAARLRNSINLARRFALAKAVGGERLFVDAPLRRIGSGGAGFEPTEEFPVIRTMMRLLTGKRLLATLHPAPDVIALIFGSTDESAMVIWSWREGNETTPVEMYLGQSPQIFNLDGAACEAKRSGGRTVIEAASAPLIVVGLRSPQTLLQASFSVSPRNIQQHDPEPRPMLRFRNPYSEPLRGELLITPPENWQVTPATVPIELAAGEVLEHALDFELPPRQVAAEHSFGVKLHIRVPDDVVLEFQEQLSVGLHDIELSTATRWQGDSLIVAQTLRNKSDKLVSFGGFCAAPNRPRAEAVFVDVRPSESITQSYVFVAADNLAGARLHLGVQEIRGERRLNQLVVVGPK